MAMRRQVRAQGVYRGASLAGVWRERGDRWARLRRRAWAGRMGGRAAEAGGLYRGRRDVHAEGTRKREASGEGTTSASNCRHLETALVSRALRVGGESSITVLCPLRRLPATVRTRPRRSIRRPSAFSVQPRSQKIVSSLEPCRSSGRNGRLRLESLRTGTEHTNASAGGGASLSADASHRPPHHAFSHESARVPVEERGILSG
ncbi:hypothetical protein OH77DRAFT_682390 [Trametes cingulata]|nr:hypothetical protein OH77DRAFT_682390 [Trametes cingulata]